MRPILFAFVGLMATVAVCTAEAPRFRFQARQRFGKFARQEIESDVEQSPPASEGPYPPAGLRPGREFPLPTETEEPFEEPTTVDNEFTDSTTTDSVDEQPTEAQGPYAPSGWQPNGQLLALPTFQRQQQQQPDQTYGAPAQAYGLPETTTGSGEFDSEASDASETNETTDEPESELLLSSAQQYKRPLSASEKLQRKPEKLQQQPQQQFAQQLASSPSGSYYVQLPQAPSAAFYQLGAQLQAQPLSAGAVYPVQSAAYTAPLNAAAYAAPVTTTTTTNTGFIAAPAKLQFAPRAAFVYSPQVSAPLVYSQQYVSAAQPAVSYSSAQYQQSW